MRKIKFRAWQKYSLYMYEVTAIQWSAVIDHELSRLELLSLDGLYTVTTVQGSATGNYELMQYTGLKDRNGTEIYEGDIIVCRVGYHKDEPFAVTFGIQEFADSNYQAFCLGYNLDPDVSQHYEIIGNIYKTPDLLSKKD